MLSISAKLQARLQRSLANTPFHVFLLALVWFLLAFAFCFNIFVLLVVCFDFLFFFLVLLRKKEHELRLEGSERS